MSQQHRNIPPASTRAPSSSALPREHDDDTHNAGGGGGKAAERGRQPPTATRPPCTPSSQNTVNKWLINLHPDADPARLPLRSQGHAHLVAAGTDNTPDHKRYPPGGPGSPRSRQKLSDAAGLIAHVSAPDMGSNRDLPSADTAEIPCTLDSGP